VGTVERFGGIHTGISGGRTVDTLGYKTRYEFELPFLDLDEHAWLEAVFTRQIPGNVYLINPLKKNLLSREAASSKPSGTNTAGIYTTSGSASWIRVLDGPVSWTQRAAQWVGMQVDTRLHFDYEARIPVVDGKDMTFSVYVRSDEAATITGFSQPYLNGTWLGTRNYTSEVTLVADTWTRIQITQTGNTSVSDELHFGIQYEGNGSANVAIQVTGAQAEFSSEPTDPALGGGSSRVGIEAMETVSPYYPYQSVSLKILEV
jgi:hypothetical protein